MNLDSSPFQLGRFVLYFYAHILNRSLNKYFMKELCEKVINIVSETGTYINSEKKNFSQSADVERKGHSNFVTYVDKNAEKMLVSALGQLVPGSGFIAEEGTSELKGAIYNWIIDPLDGTTNFIHGLTPHAISVGLMKHNEMVLGVVLEINSGEMFSATKGGGAFLNGKQIRVSGNSEHQQALIATGYPYYDFSKIDKYILALREIMEKASGIRRLGSAAVDLCYVACGRFEAFWETGLSPWDVAAGTLIVNEAGGKVTDFSGRDNYLFGREIIATNALYYNNFYEIVNKHLGS
jgi:myo-inositol-1(or 4)-monophosphatase